jgi:hypothetical protein
MIPKTRASPLDAICRPRDDAVLRKFGDVLSDLNALSFVVPIGLTVCFQLADLDIEDRAVAAHDPGAVALMIDGRTNRFRLDRLRTALRHT